MSATEVPEIVQLVLNMELLAISSMYEVGSEHKISFGAFLRHKKGFEHHKNHLRSVTSDRRPPPSAEKVTLSSGFFLEPFR